MATHTYRQPKKPKDDPIEVRIVLGVLRGLMWLVMLPFRGLTKPSPARRRGAVNTQEVAQRWADIQTSVGLGGTTHFGAAVVAADKLLDSVLKQHGYPGDTMGERLKGARDDVSPAVYHNVWQAHKLRNQLVHEVGMEVMSFQVKEALQSYEAMLRELGVLR